MNQTTRTVPMGTMAAAFESANATAAIKAATNYSYFDPIDFLDENIKSIALKERVLSYMAWKIDMTIINTARQLFWEAYKDAQTNAVIEFESFLADFRGSINVQENFGSGKALNLCRLIELRPIFHEYAASAAAHMNRDYKQRELIEMLVLDDTRVQSLDTAKIKMEAHECADGDEALELELIEAGVARATKQLADRKETQVKLRPCVLDTIEAARAVALSEPAMFWELDDELQADFTVAAIAAIKSAKKQLSTTASVTTSDYKEVITDARNLTAELELIIDKKFSDTVKAQSSIDTGREAGYKARKAAIAAATAE